MLLGLATVVVGRRSRPRQRDELLVGHRPHRLEDSLLDAKTGFTDPAERRQLGPAAWDLVDVDRAAPQLPRAADGVREAVSHHPGAEPELGAVGDLEGRVEIGDADHRRDGAECLEADDVLIGTHVVEQRRRHEGARTGAA